MDALSATTDSKDAAARRTLEMNPFTLAFSSEGVEGEYLGDVAKRRCPVLIFIFCFDILCFLFRFLSKLRANGTSGSSSALEIVLEMGHQLANMAMLYILIGLLNKRARKSGNNAARQEEVLLSVCMALAICNLLASLRPENSGDYVYMAYFLICTSTFLKIRWWVGTGLLASPTIAVQVWHGKGDSFLPPDAVVHIIVAWAVGGLMAYLADWYRRQMFANQKLALAAHEKELLEARARMQAQRELAAAQAQAAQRALSVAREKAANEAKSEFMSLMCHEVRTPLNGCLASAEMLLETALEEEQRELAKTIRVSGSILLSTVSNFLDFFKLEAGKRLDIVRTEVDLADLVGDVHCIIEAMVGRGGLVRLKPPDLSGVPACTVYCDPDRLRGILLNLYTNAAKFTKQGEISLKVNLVEPGYVPPPPPGFVDTTIKPSVATLEDRRCFIHGFPAVEAAAAAAAAGECQADVAATTAAPLLQVTEQQQQQHLAPREYNGEEVAAKVSDGKPQQQQGPGVVHVRAQTDASLSAAAVAAAVPSLAVVGAVAAGGGSSSSSKGFIDSSSCSCSSSSASTAAGEGLFEAGTPDGCSTKAYAGSTKSSMDSSTSSSSGAHVGPGTSQREQEGRSSGSSSDRGTCWLLFEVLDTGVGIAGDGLQTLFREYVQGTEDEMRKPRAKGGTGLGLSICSKQVGVLGGCIGAHSAKGLGSNFWFKVPVRRGRPLRWQEGTGEGLLLNPGGRLLNPGESRLRRHSSRNLGSFQQQQQQEGVPVEVGGSCSSSSSSHGVVEGFHGSSSSSSSLGAASGSFFGPALGPRGPGAAAVAAGGLLVGSSSSSSLLAAAAGGGVGASSSSDHQMQEAGLWYHGGPSGTSSSNRSSSNGLEHLAPAAASGGGMVLSQAAQEGQPPQPRQQLQLQQLQLPEAAQQPKLGACHGLPRGPPGSSSQGPGGVEGSSTRAAAPGPRHRPGAVASKVSLDGSSRPALDVSGLLGLRVLLAEDNLINQTVAKKMITSLGATVQVAVNGQEALAAVEKAGQRCPLLPAAAAAGGGGAVSTSSSSISPGTQVKLPGGGSNEKAIPAAAAAGEGAAAGVQGPAVSPDQGFDLVLMDMAMPIMGGVEATKAIRALGYTLPIVAMTANASDKDREECAEAGMNGFLSKPVLRDQLARALLAVLPGAAPGQ